MIVIEFPVLTNTEHMLLQPVRGSLSDASGFSVSVFLDVLGRLFEMETGMFFFFGCFGGSFVCNVFVYVFLKDMHARLANHCSI